MVCDGPNWCLADFMLRNYYQNFSKKAKTGVIKYFMTDRHFLPDQQTFVSFFFKWSIFSPSQVKQTLCFA